MVLDMTIWRSTSVHCDKKKRPIVLQSICGSTISKNEAHLCKEVNNLSSKIETVKAVLQYNT